MVTIILSDTHLTRWFNKRTFNYLRRIISASDRVIINGDFWDGCMVSFDKFINSRWCKLFPLLKSKNTIYIYGNHDRIQWCNEKVFLFSERQAEIIKMRINGRTYLFEHGNRIVPAPDDIYPWLTNRKLRIIISILLRSMGRISSIYYGRIRRHKYNKKIKEYWQKNGRDGQILVCGHSHVAELDFKAKYINSGFIRHGYARYLKIKDGKPELVKERY